MAQRRRSFPPKKIVNYTWSTFVMPADLTVPTESKILLGSFFPGTAFEETLVRTRGVLSIGSDQAAASEEQVGAFGLIRITDAAFAIGITAIPGPVTDGDDDGWVVWVPFSQHSTKIPSGIPSVQYTIDSKAQRIVREGQRLAVVLENFGDFGLDVSVSMRALSRFRS